MSITPLDGNIKINTRTGETYVFDDYSQHWSLADIQTPDPEIAMRWRSARDQYRRDAEIEEATHRERMDALSTLFPRGHDKIQNLDIMVDIARENQLNPLYEQALKEFDEAKLAMSRAANKLASVVKLTDSEEVETRSARPSADNYTSLFSPAGMNYTYAQAQSMYPSISSRVVPKLSTDTTVSTPTPVETVEKTEQSTFSSRLIKWIKSLNSGT